MYIHKVQIVCFISEIQRVILFVSLTDDECRDIMFKEPVANRAMKNHVIRSEEVPNEGTCRVLCYMEPNCVSINLGPLEGGKHNCKLNNATDENQFTMFLVDKPYFTYLAIEVFQAIQLAFHHKIQNLKKGRKLIFPKENFWGTECAMDMKSH